MPDRPDVIILMTDEERAVPPYESDEVLAWRERTLTGQRWFDEHGVRFDRHYTGSLACVPSRPTLFTGQYPDVHGVTQTDGLGKMADDTRMRWMRPGEVPTLGNWFRAAGYDTHYDGKWHITHADLHDADGNRVDTNDDDGNVDRERRAARTSTPTRSTRTASPAGSAPSPTAGCSRDAGIRRDPLIADRVVAWLEDRYARRARRRRRRPPPVPARGQLREPARHRAVPAVVAPEPARAVAARPAATCRRRRRPTRTCRPSRRRRSRSASRTTRATARRRRSARIYERSAQTLP